MKSAISVINKKNLTALILTITFMVGLFPATINAKGYVYVDDSASGKETGSYSNPYSRIQDAIDKAQKEGKNVTIRKGVYEENIVISSNVEVYGTDRNDVIIKAHNDDNVTVEMHDDTKLAKVTVRDGKYGVLVTENDSAIISDCKIIKNGKDGIKARRASRKSKYKLEVYDSFIAYNGWNGIYSERRKAIVKNNEIYYNDGDGVEFKKKSEVTFEKNRVKENDGVGLKMTIDGGSAWIDKNTFYNNDKDGVEVRTEGETGIIQIKKNKLYKNDGWGIARVEKRPFSDVQWNGSLKIISDNIYWENEDGDVSPIVNVY